MKESNLITMEKLLDAINAEVEQTRDIFRAKRKYERIARTRLQLMVIVKLAELGIALRV